MQYQYQRAQIAEEAFNVHAETGLSPRQLVDQRAELLEACKSAMQELYDLSHSSGNPDDPNNMQSDAVVYRELKTAIANAERKP